MAAHIVGYEYPNPVFNKVNLGLRLIAYTSFPYTHPLYLTICVRLTGFEWRTSTIDSSPIPNQSGSRCVRGQSKWLLKEENFNGGITRQ